MFKHPILSVLYFMNETHTIHKGLSNNILPWNRPHSGDYFAWSFAGFIIYIFLLTHNNIKHHHQHETYGEADGAEIAVLAA